jgi:hypothetical protein
MEEHIGAIRESQQRLRIRAGQVGLMPFYVPVQVSGRRVTAQEANMVAGFNQPGCQPLSNESPAASDRNNQAHSSDVECGFIADGLIPKAQC